MAARRAQAPVSKNGAIRRQSIINETEVSRFVGEFQPRNETRFAEAKVQVNFKVKASEARVVSVAGTFNGWDPKGTALKREGDAWNATIELSRGRYEYKFIVDGQWVSDPSAPESVPNPFGTHNSVLSV
jgi:1,4-alpha-glucan branching enzyme